MKHILVLLLLPIVGFSQTFPIQAKTSTTKWVEKVQDLPSPINGVITLDKDHCYILSGILDLLGNRLITSGRNSISGTSSEVQKIVSTGLSNTLPLIQSDSTITLRNISIEHEVVLELNAVGNNEVLDWTGVNIINSNYSTISNFSVNLNTCAFVESSNFVLSGTINSFAVQNSFFNSSSGTIFNFPSTASVTTRIRFNYCSFVCLSGESAFSVDPVSVQNERFVLTYCNFSGGGNYIQGVDYTSPKAFFQFNGGITNSLDFTLWDKSSLDDLSTSTLYSGDISGTYSTLQISDNTVSNSNLEDMGYQTLKGRISVGSGDPEDISLNQLKSLLNLPLNITLSSNQTLNTITLTPITGLSFTADPNSVYKVEVDGVFQSAATTTGLGLALDIPLLATVSGYISHPTSNTAIGIATQTVDNVSTATTGVPLINMPYVLNAQFQVTTGATGGIIQLTGKSEIAASNITLLGNRVVLTYKKL